MTVRVRPRAPLELSIADRKVVAIFLLQAYILQILIIYDFSAIHIAVVYISVMYKIKSLNY